jgi:tRNA(Ile)-lysidine synthase
MFQRSEIYRRWALVMRRRGYFGPGERVGVAVSGGADSVLLLDFMRQLAQECGFSLAIVHFNHHLRGSESEADESFVRGQAEKFGLQFLSGGADVAGVARDRHRNLEATARELRYQYFHSLLNFGTLQKIATAHTANDQAETVLLRLLRGTGTRGLGGIYPTLTGKIIRPFLELTRLQVEAEVGRRNLQYRVDLTNLDSRFLRNRVRMELLPLLEKEYNPKATSLLAELAERARADEEFLEQQARERALAWRVREGSEEKIPLQPLREFPVALQRRILRQMLEAARGHLRGITHRQIEGLRQFSMGAPSGRKFILSDTWQARREYDWLVVGREKSASGKTEFCHSVEIPGQVALPGAGIRLEFKIVDSADWVRTYNKQGVAGLDPQKLRGKLVLRNWRSGDRYRPVGSRKAKKLKELLARRKIPVGLRKSWPVLECAGEPVWSRGFPPAHSVAALAGSARVLMIEEIPLGDS